MNISVKSHIDTPSPTPWIIQTFSSWHEKVTWTRSPRQKHQRKMSRRCWKREEVQSIPTVLSRPRPKVQIQSDTDQLVQPGDSIPWLGLGLSPTLIHWTSMWLTAFSCPSCPMDSPLILLNTPHTHTHMHNITHFTSVTVSTGEMFPFIPVFSHLQCFWVSF